MANEFITKEQFNDGLGAICDIVSAGDMSDQLKGGKGLKITSLMCDAAGNSLFSYDTVLKYARDEYGKEKITAEVAGKIVGDFVFDQGMKQTVRTALVTVGATFSDSPLSAGVAGVGVFTTGYALTKTAQAGAEQLTISMLEKVLTKDTIKIEHNDEQIYDKSTKTATFADLNTAKALAPTIANETGATNAKIGDQTYTLSKTQTTTILSSPTQTHILYDKEVKSYDSASKQIILEDYAGKKTYVYYHEDSDVIFIGADKNNPEQIRFTNSDGNFEVLTKNSQGIYESSLSSTSTASATTYYDTDAYGNNHEYTFGWDAQTGTIKDFSISYFNRVYFCK